MNLELLNIILKQILKKNQIKNFDKNYVLDKINSYFLTNGDIYKKLNGEFLSKKEKIVKNKVFKIVVKEIKKEIGIVYGAFLTQNFKKKEKVLGKIGDSIVEIDELLKFHKSSRERFDFYSEIYEKIFIWRKPHKIADLACGLNPLSFFYILKVLGFSLDELSYFASDLNPADMDFLNSFFEKFGILGVARDYDLTDLKILNDDDLQSSDMVFLFKALDSLEYVKRDISKELLLGLRPNLLVISFPKKSLVSKKEFNMEKRAWFVKFMIEQNWSYESFEVENELFFLIDKSKIFD